MKVGLVFFSQKFFNKEYPIILKELKKKCNYLIVGLMLDTKLSSDSLSSLSIMKRYSLLKKINCVDEIVPFVNKQDLEDIVKSFHLNLLVIDDIHFSKDFKWKDYCAKNGIEIFYLPSD